MRAIIDLRPDVPDRLLAAARRRDIPSIAGGTLLRANGRPVLRSVTLRDRADRRQEIRCDLLAVCGGWNPALHLHAQARGRPVFDPARAIFVPGGSVQAERSAGAATGAVATALCEAQGMEAGWAAAEQAGYPRSSRTVVAITPAVPDGATVPPWMAQSTAQGRGKRFADLQNDVTDADIALAVREGYRSVEHVKRYTTLGMGTDQGKTSNVAGFGLIARSLAAEVAAIGTTTFRPPYTPVTLGDLAGMHGGRNFAPDRRTPMHDWHVAHGAVMVTAGHWLRPQCYPRPGEDPATAAQREARTVRRSVGIVDVSTLGKIEILGKDAAEFLERIYVNIWSTLRQGRCRYGVMLREDGIVFDDGTTTRIGLQRFAMTTTTHQAAAVLRHLEFHRQVTWPDLDVQLVATTDSWATVALAGPDSRAVLAPMVEGTDVGGAALPYMGALLGSMGGVPARVMRISFSGERAYEISVPADCGTALWERLLQAGARFDIAPYGIDAMSILRIEKGHVGGAELNGRTTLDDLGLGRMMRRSGDFIGRRSLSRPGLSDPGRRQLVGLIAEDAAPALPRGAQIVADKRLAAPNPMLGELTSSCFSPVLGRALGLALIGGGRRRHGEVLHAVSPVRG